MDGRICIILQQKVSSGCLFLVTHLWEVICIQGNWNPWDWDRDSSSEHDAYLFLVKWQEPELRSVPWELERPSFGGNLRAAGLD